MSSLERGVFRLERVSSAAERASFDEAVRLLVASFFDDPFYAYIMPDKERRTGQLEWWMTTFFKNALLSGEVLLTGEPGAPTGAALWLGSRAPVPQTLRVARSGLITAPVRLGLSGFGRMMRVTDAWQKLHRQEARPHWYLNFIGVSPKHQGQGHGSRLIRAMTARADQAGLNCYLETCSETNVKIYNRHGFEAVTSQTYTDGAAPWASWTMRRRPQAAQR